MGRSAIVLAAGLGTRMKSKHHKVLHTVCGKPMIVHILDELEKLQLEQIIVVVGQQRETVAAAVAGRADIAIQDEQLGTGHAVQCAMPHLAEGMDTTVVLYGDAPLIRAQTIDALLETQASRHASAVVLTATVSNPAGLGRVVLGQDNRLERIVEEKDATPEERAIHQINTGIYAFDTADLRQALGALKPENAQGEYYLTDTIAILRAAGKPVLAQAVDDPEEILSVNDRVQLSVVEKTLQRRIREHWMRQGVTMVDPDQVYIGLDVEIGRDTVLYPGTFLEGRTVIGEDCTVGPNTRLVDTTVQAGAVVQSSVALECVIGPEAAVGPFAYLRPGTEIGARVKIGDFVEVKKSTIGDDTKISHLAYVGDARVGQRVNIGCGVITVNYDGKDKHQTVIGNDSFVGSNVNLIAPVEIGDGAYVCAGSTITDTVPNDGFAIARSRQVTKADYVQSWQKKRQETEK
ncbi:bifunctional UDP-N-acetylglucosamine diphosphorylase/glucosamine-1-phosphate N-acetyltransferase GlmU [Alicyclobacillus cycloheptanicus]|uniref:Bifunctional protein GlmU n=1 Tax=Alicyclobacillus cycloheptanicus TaxID=1457 RepID=A0ABT9XIM3_9BACL|nr:bifunctional UDP-N-acetylglucosamine diphosphorylase/glucosamine-1-phosphate N-acetyltransferase GlmU [Alicyclobacillus cycloheptanicus]MDQ0190162.1 bifunctional UDP-N-acetylglucosamine pyrophosphorylase/glucosamine-1-phosphate N-acetyltransferase [Alicyclobacillus cycloheptanicus]